MPCPHDPGICARWWCPREVGAGRLVVPGMWGDNSRYADLIETHYRAPYSRCRGKSPWHLHKDTGTLKKRLVR